MGFSSEMLAELNLLARFNLASSQVGIKVHTSAGDATVAAAGRLFEKGLISQRDGGYLTPRGHEAAEHAQLLLCLLGPVTQDH